MVRKKILVIDDDPEILDSIKIFLEGNGYAVETAINGKAGLDAYFKTSPDLILCDMMMENIDEGINVAHKIREKDSEIPIYLLSSIGNATASNIEIDKLGFNGIYQKPIDLNKLLSSLKLILY